MGLAIAELKESLKSIGYDEKSIVDDYIYIAKGKRIKMDFIAFSDSNKKDIDTSCIAVCKKDYSMEISDYIDAFNSIGTPVAILANSNSLEFYSINSKIEKSHKFRVIRNENVKKFIIENRLSFIPENIIEKRNPYQINLFSIDYTLKEFAKQINKKLLNEKIEGAFFKAKNRFNTASNEYIEKNLMLILTALILNDKGYLKSYYSKLEEVINCVIQLYPGYFNEELLNDESKEIVNLIYKELREEVVYDRLTEDMLGSFYEDFLITDKLRDELGIHYTPSYVAKDILQRLPIEDIPKEKRVVLDGTCGHGSLLLAAYDRLNEMDSYVKETSLDYLKERIIGIDKDDTATDISKLSLLLKSLDKTNGWKIFGGKDFLTENLNRYTKRKPTIIVANPPFKEDGRSREELAGKFVEKYLEWLEEDGLMGIILPSTFLEKDSCSGIRNKIIENCEILEVWTLPPGIFAKANFSSIVLLLRNRRSGNDNTVLRYIKKTNKKEYSINHKSSFSSFVPAKFMWNKVDLDNSMNLMFDYKIWSNLICFDNLGKYFEVKNGLQVINEEREEALSYNFRSGMKKWIQKSKYLDAFTLLWEKSNEPKYIDIDVPIHRDRKEIRKFIEDRKIIINSKYNPDTLWRLYACVDNNSIFPNETFHIVYPKDGVSKDMVDKVEIILNSIIANLWVYTYSRKRTISPDIIKSIPICNINNKQYKNISSIVRHIKKEKISDKPDYNILKKLFYKMDEIIMDCYGFDDSMKKNLKFFFEGYERKGIRNRKILDSINKKRENCKFDETMMVTGIVDDIYLDTQTIELMINGLDKKFYLKIKKDFPGWLLRKGTTFTAMINISSDEIVNIFNFKQLGYSIFDDFDILSDFFGVTNDVIEGSDN